jgi:hypothetical protein
MKRTLPYQLSLAAENTGHTRIEAWHQRAAVIGNVEEGAAVSIE